MDLDKLKKILEGATELAWSHGGAGRFNGNPSIVIPLVAKALQNCNPEDLQRLLLEAAK